MIDFALNYTNVYLIDVTPGSTSPTWARIGAGISSVEPAGNEKLDQSEYYDGDGLASTDVVGGQFIYTFDGARKYGDPAQDFIAGLQHSYGAARKTRMKHIAPNGDTITGDVTIANIKNGGGDANSKGNFGFEAHFNGLPTFTPGNKTEMPTEIAVAETLALTVGGDSRLTVTATPASASAAAFFAIDDDTVATVDADGNVTALAAGIATISVKSAVKPSCRTAVSVTVTAP